MLLHVKCRRPERWVGPLRGDEPRLTRVHQVALSKRPCRASELSPRLSVGQAGDDAAELEVERDPLRIPVFLLEAARENRD